MNKTLKKLSPFTYFIVIIQSNLGLFCLLASNVRSFANDAIVRKNIFGCGYY
jgi:hypothetical protein